MTSRLDLAAAARLQASTYSGQLLYDRADRGAIDGLLDLHPADVKFPGPNFLWSHRDDVGFLEGGFEDNRELLTSSLEFFVVEQDPVVVLEPAEHLDEALAPLRRPDFCAGHFEALDAVSADQGIGAD